MLRDRRLILLVGWILVAGFLLPKPAQAGIALDGHTTGTSSSGSTLTSGTLTTANAGDVIVAFVSIAGTTRSVSSIATTGVVWHGTARKRLVNNNGLELWYGTATGTVSATTTVTLSGNAASGISVFGVSGANFSSFNDPNASLPASNTGSSTTPTLSTISTSNANDMLIAGAVINSSNITWTAGSGYTLIDGIVAAAGENVASEDQIVSSTQTNATASFTVSGGTGGWVIIADAIQAASAVHSMTLPLLGVGN